MTRLAFLFLIVDTLPYEDLWTAWLGHLPDAHVHIHAKHPERIRSEWVRQRLITSSSGDIVTYRPDWGSIELVRAMLALLRAALRDPDVGRLCFLSESCLPAVDPAAAERTLLGATRSWLDIKFRPNNGYSALHQFAPMRCGWRPAKADQWCLLLRAHAERLLRQPRCWQAFKRVKAADEIFIPTLLRMYGILHDEGTLVCHHGEDECRSRFPHTARLSWTADGPDRTVMRVKPRTDPAELSTDDIMNAAILALDTDWPVYGEVESRKLTYVDWSYSCLHPTTFRWNLALHRRAQERGCLFVRKVIDVDHDAWRQWLAAPTQYIPATPLLFRDNDKDRRNRSKLQHYTDCTTPYNERLWPEADCWDYVTQRTTNKCAA
jgi:hypothetical protein